MNTYQMITNQIISNLENATTWSDMISSGRPINITGRAYRGINLMLLYNSNFKSRIWGTFHQIIKHGGRVRRSEKSSIVGFWSKYKPEPSEQNKEPTERWYLKIYRVFNVEQCEFIEGNEYLESLDDQLNEEPIPKVPNEVVSEYLKRENITLQRISQHSVPYYSPNKDFISITDHILYKSNDEYFMSLFHELTHSTGHPKRLNRFEVGNTVFGSQDYSLEELVAEIGANFLSAETAIKPDFLNSVGYIKGWIPQLIEHPRWIVSAAAKAEQAVEYILKGGIS